MGIYEDAYAHPDLAAAIEAKDCHEIARVLSIGRTKTALISLADIQAVLHKTGTWWAMKPILSQPDHPAYIDVVVVMDVTHALYTNLDTTLPLTAKTFTSLVAAGLMDQSVLDQIMAMDAVPDPLTQREVAIALYHDTGEPK